MINLVGSVRDVASTRSACLELASDVVPSSLARGRPKPLGPAWQR